MAIHSFHPSTHEFGLADDCERCDEHAERPLDGLDDGNLSGLVDRLLKGLTPRSQNEMRAMRVLKGTIQGYHYLCRVTNRPNITI